MAGDMAKFGRYDPSNKKQDRNKKISLDKEKRIREQGQINLPQVPLREVQFEENYTDADPQQLNG
jgi:hypothetical protein